MPLYEVTLITKSLSKVSFIASWFHKVQADLVKTLVRAGNTLLDHGAVIEKVESLGHKDLPYKRVTKQTGEPVYASKLVFFVQYLYIFQFLFISCSYVNRCSKNY